MYTLKEISDVLKCDVPLVAGTFVKHLLTDSRSLLHPSTTLFFALVTNRNDGHLYIGELYAKGVRLFVVHPAYSPTSDLVDAVFFKVNNTLEALQQIAAYHRSRFHYPVIGITGSNGKTVVKEWLHQLLNHRFNVVRSPRSYNSQIGVPQSLWGLGSTHELALIEAGISRASEMERLEKMIQPTLGLLTHLGPAHDEGFQGRREKIQEKLKLFLHTDSLVYQKSDSLLEEGITALQTFRQQQGIKPLQLFNWGKKGHVTLKIVAQHASGYQTILEAIYQGHTKKIILPFIDEASIENGIHCWAMMLLLGCSDEEIASGMLKLESLAMRMEVKKARNQCLLINDSYSNDLHSFNIALDFMMQQGSSGKRTVVLSDFLQTGQPENELYGTVAGALAQRGVNRLIAVGPRMASFRHLFLQVGGMTSSFYSSTEAFLKELSQLDFHQELILLKGARQFAFEKIDRQLELQSHQTVLEINLQAILQNLRFYQQQLKKGTRVMAMVKAFAYGSGGFEIAQLLQYHKVDYLAVAYTDEAVELRKAGILLPLMIMNPEPSDFYLMLEYQLEPVVYSMGLLLALENYLEKQGIRDFPIHVELETGMNRLGFEEAELPQLIQQLKKDCFKVQSVFSHLVASENPAHIAFTRQQSAMFNKICQFIAAHLSYPFLQHLANTAAITHHPEFQYDMVRLGIGLYGVEEGNRNLKQASTLKTRIAQLKNLEPGATIGYGRKGVVTQNMTIATIRIGYADGYPRQLSNGVGKVWIKGALAPVVGWICMDMTMVDVTHITDVAVGDEVIVFGEELPLTALAAWADTIPYEIIAGVSQRVKRVYYNE